MNVQVNPHAPTAKCAVSQENGSGLGLRWCDAVGRRSGAVTTSGNQAIELASGAAHCRTDFDHDTIVWGGLPRVVTTMPSCSRRRQRMASWPNDETSFLDCLANY